LLASDTVIIKIRHLLLQTLKDHATNKPLPSMLPTSYRVRSTRCEAPKGASLSETIDRYVRIDAPAAIQ